jgi:hypothetical protein
LVQIIREGGVKFVQIEEETRGDNSKKNKSTPDFFFNSSPEPASQIQSNLIQIIFG